MAIRWQAALVLMVFLAAAVYVAAQDQPPIATLTLDQPLHFLTKDGSDVVLAPCTYRLEATQEHQLRLRSESVATPVTVETVELPHDRELTAPVAGMLATDEDSFHVVLFLPGGKALNAVGSRSGVRTRAGALTSTQLSQMQVSPSTLKTLNETVRPVGSPPAPILDNPALNSVLTNPQVRFHWHPAVGQPAPARYEICVTEVNQACTNFNAIVFKTMEAASAVGTAQYEFGVGAAPGTGSSSTSQTTTPITATQYVVSLPLRFHGKRLQWSVMACAPYRLGESCSTSAPRPIGWPLAAPTLAAPANNSTLTSYTPSFTWSHPHGAAVTYFLICIGKPGIPCPVHPIVRPDILVIEVRGAVQYTHPQDLSPFMLQSLYWSVAACNSTYGCVYQPQGHTVRVPGLPGTFGALYPVFQNSKCTNCHGMASDNAKYQQHVAEGRFSAGTNPTYSEHICRRCHTEATGFVNSWRAPNRNEDFSGTSLWNSCIRGQDRGAFISGTGRDHLKKDQRIRWAVMHIPGMTLAAWHGLVDAWFDAGAPCICEPDNDYGSCHGDVPRYGQFTR